MYVFRFRHVKDPIVFISTLYSNSHVVRSLIEATKSIYCLSCLFGMFSPFCHRISSNICERFLASLFRSTVCRIFKPWWFITDEILIRNKYVELWRSQETHNTTKCLHSFPFTLYLFVSSRCLLCMQHGVLVTIASVVTTLNGNFLFFIQIWSCAKFIPKTMT